MFTADDVISAMRKVVERMGSEYVYPENEKRNGMCMYSHDGRPSCIVGYVINELDPAAFQQLAEAEQIARSGKEAEDLVYALWLDADFWDRSGERVASDAQLAQDRGAPWGTALAVAEDAM